MKMQSKCFAAIALAVALVLGGASIAWAAAPGQPRPASVSAKPPPGVEAAQTLSTVTGVAISPLLGVGSVGLYQWWKAPPQNRASLPWYAKPWFWVPALLLVVVVGLKDVLGTAAPTALKKPFDVAEAIENKISGLVMAGAFIPLIISIFPEAAGNQSFHPAAATGFATLGLATIGNALLVPFALAAFAVVWMASHAVNMLILLSPFTTVDAILKTMRIGVLGLVTATSFANPYLGAIVSAAIILFCYFIAGWSFRLAVFGSVYAFDYVTFRRCRFQPGAEFNRAFTARTIENIPARTYGKLKVGSDGKLVFVYRPLLVLKEQQRELPAGTYAVGRGIFCPELDKMEGERATCILIFPPRYSTHEEALARTYRLSKVRDAGVLRGMKAGWSWLKGLFKPAQALPPSAPVPVSS